MCVCGGGVSVTQLAWSQQLYVQGIGNPGSGNPRGCDYARLNTPMCSQAMCSSRARHLHRSISSNSLLIFAWESSGSERLASAIACRMQLWVLQLVNVCACPKVRTATTCTSVQSRPQHSRSRRDVHVQRSSAGANSRKVAALHVQLHAIEGTLQMVWTRQ